MVGRGEGFHAAHMYKHAPFPITHSPCRHHQQPAHVKGKVSRERRERSVGKA